MISMVYPSYEEFIDSIFRGCSGITYLGDHPLIGESCHERMCPCVDRDVVSGIVGCQKLIWVRVDVRADEEVGGNLAVVAQKFH